MATKPTTKKTAAKPAAKKAETTTAKETTQPDGVATKEQNDALEHSEGGVTTRDDRLDVGVPMLPGSPKEPQGPEDALGAGDKRGDYRERVPGEPHTSVPVEGGGQPVHRWVDGETGAAAKEGDKGAVQVVVDYAPVSEIVRQKPRTEEIGDVEGKKGGVTTDEAVRDAA